MTSEEIKNMSFEDFRTQIEGMEEVQKLTADGTERYGKIGRASCRERVSSPV